MRLIFTILISGISVFGFSQDTLFLNFDQILQKGKAENLAVQKADLGIVLAKANLEKSQDWWLPDVFLGTSTHNLTGNAMNGNGAFFTEVDRQNRWLGGEITADWDLGNGIFKTKAEKLKFEASKYAAVAKRNEEALKIIKAYYELISAQKQQTILSNLITQNEKLATSVENQAAEGMARRSDFLLLKTKSNQLAINRLESNHSRKSAQGKLIQLLNLPADSEIILDEKDFIQVPTEVNFSIDYDGHPILKESDFLQKSIEAESKTVTTGLLLPDARLRYQIGNFGVDYADGAGTNQLNLAIGWNLPLGEIFYGGEGKKLKTESAIRSLDYQMKRQKIDAETRQLKAQIELSRQQLDLAIEGRNFAKEAYDQTVERQKSGIGTIFETLQVLEIFNEAETTYITSLSAYNLLIFKYLHAVGKNL